MPNIVTNNLDSLKEIEMQDMTDPKIQIVKITRVVKCCRHCQMVNINDRSRMLCPYCGTFYDSKAEREKNQIESRAKNTKNEKILKARKNQNDKSDGEETQKINAETVDFKQIDNSGGIKNFFRNLMARNLVNKKDDTSKSESFLKNSNVNKRIKKTYIIEEETNLTHRFLTVKNNDLSIFDDYRNYVSTIKDLNEFKSLTKRSFDSKDFAELSDFFCWIFSKASNLFELLVSEKEGSKLKLNASKSDLRSIDVSYNMITNWRFMREIYNSLIKMPKQSIDLVCTSISFCIANDLRPLVERLTELGRQKCEGFDTNLYVEYLSQLVHIYNIYLCNPLFKRYEKYTLFSIILSEIASLNNDLQHSLILAMRRIPLNLYREILTQIQLLLTSNLDPIKVIDKSSPLPGDWIQSAVKVMLLLHCTNEMQIQYYQQHYTKYPSISESDIKPHGVFGSNTTEKSNLESVSMKWICSASTTSSLFISYKEFYIFELNKLELYSEYIKWQKLGPSDSGFSFCQYPFILSLTAKRDILEQDSEQQMIKIAKKSYINRAKSRGEAPQSEDLFLTIKVNRSNLVSDSMNEIATKKADLKKKLRVEFVGEAAIDMGGVRKEWFLLLVRQCFGPLYGMFTLVKESNVHWFTTQGMEAEYNLIGVLMGLAVYNGEILDIHFPPCVYKKLLPSSMSQISDPNAIVGVTSLGLYDLKHIYPVVAASLQNLLDYEGNVEEDFLMNFEVSYSEFDVLKMIPLKEGGANIKLTNENRKEYVNLYVDFMLNKSIYKQFAAFFHGFHSVCASNAVILLRPEEIESLVCGSTEMINIDELKLIAIYDGYTRSDKVINWFWTILKDEFSYEEQKRLLLFTTGSDRIPIGGIREMKFKITRIESKQQLPMSHTCFNQLVLPNYKSKEILYSKLKIAIENAEGFGFK